MRPRFNSLAPSLLLLGSLMLPVNLEARSRPAQELGEENLEFIADLAPSKLGTDRQGNLWTWSRGLSTVEVFNPKGTRILQFEVPRVRSLAVDSSWGVVAVSTSGAELELVSNDGTARTILLENNAAHVAWIDGTTVALSTTQAAKKVEIWDVRRELLLRSFGPAEEIVPSVGAVLLRSLILRYSPPTGMLFALDSVNGILESWTLDGQIVRKEVFPSHRKAEIEEWLANFDRQAKAENQKFTPFYEVLRLAVDTNGSAWVVRNCSPRRDRATLLQISEGSSKTLELDLPKPCCSNNFTIWNNYFISVLAARSESSDCAVWKDLP